MSFLLWPEVITAAKEVVNSLNKNILFVAPLEKEKTEQLQQQFLSKLPYFGIIKDQDQLIVAILKGVMEVTEYELQPFSGLSDAQTFGVFVPNFQGQLTYFFKTTEIKTWELAREISSLQQFGDLHLSQSTLPKIVAAAIYQLEENGPIQSCFVETAAKGKSLSKLIEEQGGQEKFITLKKGIKKAAQGLAELHLKNRLMATPVSKEVSDFNINLFEIISGKINQDILNGEIIGLSAEEVGGIKKKIIDSVENQWGMTSYTHGDCHLEHLFFDPISDQLTWIDTSTFLSSIDHQGRPIGFAPYDFSWTWGTIADKGFRKGLTILEVETLQTLFTTEYEQLMGENLSPLPSGQIANGTKLLYFIRKAKIHQNRLLTEAGEIIDKRRI